MPPKGQPAEVPIVFELNAIITQLSTGDTALLARVIQAVSNAEVNFFPKVDTLHQCMMYTLFSRIRMLASTEPLL